MSLMESMKAKSKGTILENIISSNIGKEETRTLFEDFSEQYANEWNKLLSVPENTNAYAEMGVAWFGIGHVLADDISEGRSYKLELTVSKDSSTLTITEEQTNKSTNLEIYHNLEKIEKETKIKEALDNVLRELTADSSLFEIQESLNDSREEIEQKSTSPASKYFDSLGEYIRTEENWFRGLANSALGYGYSKFSHTNIQSNNIIEGLELFFAEYRVFYCYDLQQDVLIQTITHTSSNDHSTKHIQPNVQFDEIFGELIGDISDISNARNKKRN